MRCAGRQEMPAYTTDYLLFTVTGKYFSLCLTRVLTPRDPLVLSDPPRVVPLIRSNYSETITSLAF